MQNETSIRLAVLSDLSEIVELSVRVQSALTNSGSLQQIGPLTPSEVQNSIDGGHAYILSQKDQLIGSVLVDPLDGVFVNTFDIDYQSWGLDELPRPLWYLHALMIEPGRQGQGLGFGFLQAVVEMMREKGGSVILDCWAGNKKLKAFYEKVGFLHHGEFPEEDYLISVYRFQVGMIRKVLES
jgi:GNAT superfamily N-acetyltransferase